MKNKIGITFFALYILQDLFSIKLDFLETWQLNDSYKTWTGIVLFSLILSQWYLSFIRMNKNYTSEKKEFFIEIHKWIGVFLPLSFYIHSTSIGYGILMLLSFVFLLNIGIGFVNTENLLDKHPKYFKWWLASHIILSVAIIAFSLIHIWIVFFYN